MVTAPRLDHYAHLQHLKFVSGEIKGTQFRRFNQVPVVAETVLEHTTAPTA